MWGGRKHVGLVVVFTGVAVGLAVALGVLGAAGARHLAKDKSSCLGLKPTISGTVRGETLRGTPRRDVIQAGAGNDRVLGFAGNDAICGGFGNDTINGGLGDDRLSAQTGADVVDGGDGADTAAGGSGRDKVTGGAGSDTLGGGRGTDSVDGGDGDDRVYGGPGRDTLSPGAGTDTVFGGQGADDVKPGDGPAMIVPDPANGSTDPGDPALLPGADVVVPDESAEVLLGPDNDPTDIVPAPNWDDTVDPGGADDTVMPSPGADTVTASAGNDTVAGGDGSDTLGGGDGDDSVDGGGGNDNVDGGNGDDPALAGGDGQDSVSGGPGNDHADGGPQRDVIAGGPGADSLDGGDGGDEITGGPDDASDGADTINGGPSFDKLVGGGGNDVMDGGADADALFGQSGADQMTGGAGFDDGYAENGAGDTCTEIENPAFCAKAGALDGPDPVRDAPATGGTCDAWAANAGDDAAAGTAAAPFHTVERLVNSLRAGEAGCLVGGETYEEPDFEIHVRGGGDPGNPITLKTGPGGGSGAQPRATVKGRLWFDQVAHDVVFENLALDGNNPLAPLRGAGLPSPTVNADRISFIGDDITTSNTSTCLALGSFLGDFGEAHGTVVRGNRIHGCGVPTPPDQASGDNGLDLEGSHDAVISDNYIFGNSDRGVLIFGDVQRSQITDNAITGNRIDVHFGTAVLNGNDIVPDNNHFTNNVIAAATLARNSSGAWEVEGNKARPAAPDATDNLVDFNCIWNQDPNGNIQQPQIEFTDGGHNLVQPANGPGFANAAGEDFTLTGAAGTCPRSFGPQDPPLVDTLDPSGGTVGYSVTDRSRTAGSTVWIEYRRSGGSGTDGQMTAPVPVAPGATASARVTLPGLASGAAFRYRAVARTVSGFVYGPEKTFAGPPAAGPPVRVLPAPSATTVNLSAARTGLVKAKLRGVQSFQPMPARVQVTLGSAVDAAGGLVNIVMGVGGGLTSLGARGGEFAVRQSGSAPVATLDLTKRLRCGGRKRSRGGADTNSVAVRYSRRGNRRINVSGRFASAAVTSDARFRIADVCEGTRVSVQQGAVVVRDPRGHLVKRLRAGQVYLRRGNR